MQLSIATYNIHKGVSIDHRPIVQELKRSIRSLGADVVFLQEVQGKDDAANNAQARFWQDGGQHRYLAGPRFYSAYGKNAVYSRGHHGNALLSVWPILSHTNTDVSDHALESRGILHCVLETPFGFVYCYVVHLGLFKGSRMRQTQALIELVKMTAPTDAPVIIAGDFNDWNDHLSAVIRSALGVKEVFDPAGSDRGNGPFPNLTGKVPKPLPAKTFPALFPFFRLDRIYVRGFEVSDAEVLAKPPWTLLSDHAPLYATLERQP